MQRICVFCGSNHGGRPEYEAGARALGHALVARGLGLVYGGGNVGLMGVIADAVMERGGEVIGVIPESLRRKEVANANLTRMHVVDSMHERKALMSDLADGFIAMPGGLGTFEEFLEIVTWAQLGIHRKPCGLLNIEGYYDGLLTFLRHAVEERFLRPQHAGLVLVSDSVEALIRQMEEFRSPIIEKWMTREGT